MKTKAFFGGLIILLLVGFVTPAIAQITNPAGSIKCSEPSILNARACQQLEEQILKSTVRIKIDTWVVRADESGYELDNSVGHATLKDGRYLVTHNHFDLPLSILPRHGQPKAYGTMTLSNAAGETLYNGPLSDFELVWEDAETLVIAYKEEGLFKKLGFASAEFKEWSSVPLQGGMEVAQVDWDGETTRVDWVTVQEVSLEEGTPRLVLADDVMPGASGGGIFWQGSHIANNWLQVQQLEASGALINSSTTVALNSTQVAGQPGQAHPSG